MTAWDIGALNVELWLCCQLYCNRGDKKTEGSLKLLRSLGRGGAVVWGDLLLYFKKNLDGVRVGICLFGSVALRNTTTVDEKKGFKLNKGQIQT